MFDNNLLSCGSPGRMMDNGETFGCWCFMPYAARYKWKDCWLWELELHDDEKGWPDKYNGSYIESA